MLLQSTWTRTRRLGTFASFTLLGAAGCGDSDDGVNSNGIAVTNGGSGGAGNTTVASSGATSAGAPATSAGASPSATAGVASTGVSGGAGGTVSSGVVPGIAGTGGAPVDSGLGSQSAGAAGAAGTTLIVNTAGAGGASVVVTAVAGAGGSVSMAAGSGGTMAAGAAGAAVSETVAGAGGEAAGGAGGQVTTEEGGAGGEGGSTNLEQGGAGGEDGSAGSSGGMIEGEILFSEDFEGSASDAVPDGWESFVAWNANPMTNSSSGAEFAVADGTKPRGGSQSMHVKGGANPAQLVKTIGDFETLYVRAYVFLTEKLGQNDGANHETLIAIRHEPGGANDEIRFGEIKGVIGTNEVPTDDISPLQAEWGMGPVIPAGQWVCIEVAFLADQPYHELHAWADGELVHSITAVDQWQNGSLSASDWLTDSGDASDNQIVFGWHSFSSVTNEVWMDDIVVATGRIGCD